MNRFVTSMVALAVVALSTGCSYVERRQTTDAQRADQLARGVALASGASAWPAVRTVAFTFVVREADQVKVSRSHVWNVKENTDTVSVGDTTTTIDLANVDRNDPTQAEAFKAWTNDTYWLVAPLKLFDPGVRRDYVGRREVMGKTYEVLQLSFADVGLTPGDRYNLYVDPLTSLVAFWDYMPSPEKTVQASWEAYRHLSGLKLATYHEMGGRTITMENVRVASE